MKNKDKGMIQLILGALLLIAAGVLMAKFEGQNLYQMFFSEESIKTIVVVLLLIASLVLCVSAIMTLDEDI